MKYRTVFVSDLHLGTRISQADEFLNLLRDNDFDTIYLVGDVIGMSAIKRNFYWDEKFNTVLQKLLRLAKKGKKIVYIIRNHDIYLEFLTTEHFGNIELKERDVHIMADGTKCLVMHGHQFDGVIREIGWLYWLGDPMYDFAILLNRIFNFFRHLLGFYKWSLSLYLKTKVKNVVKFINNYEKLVVHELRKSQSDAKIVIAGHIHMIADKEISGIRYLNCGCWTEFCSAVVEYGKWTPRVS